jgi:hypothetical protein
MTIQWQSSSDGTTFTDIAGATSPKLILPSTGTYFGTNYFRAVFTAGTASTTSAKALVSVVPTTTTLSFTSPPTTAPYESTVPLQLLVSSATVPNISQGTITVFSKGSPVAGCSSLPVTNGVVQCNYTATHGTVTATYTGPTGALGSSTTATTIGLTPAITLQPVGSSVAKGTRVNLTSAAIGPGTITVQWQMSTTGKGFKPISGATSPNYHFRPTAPTTYLRAVYTAGLYNTKTQVVVVRAS